MKTKNLILSVIVLIVIIGVLYMMNKQKNVEPDPATLLFFPGFVETNCSSVLLIEKSDTARLYKKGNDWFVVPSSLQPALAVDTLKTGQGMRGFPADTALINKALVRIKTLNRDDLISKNPEKQSELEVDTVNALYVEPFGLDGKSYGAVYVGKTDASFKNYLVRARGTNDVYSALGDTRFTLFANPGRWKDRNIICFDKSKVVSVIFDSKDSGKVELVKTIPQKGDTAKPGWQIVSPVKAAADTGKVENLLNLLSHLKATEFEGNTTLTEKDLGFLSPSLVITIQLDNGASEKMVVGNDKVAMKWVRNPKKPWTTFTVYEYDLKAYNPGLGFFKK